MIKRLLNQTILSYYLYRLMGILVPLIPPCLGYPLFSGLGMLAYHLVAEARQNVHHNLSHVLHKPVDDPIVAATARQVFRYHAKNYYDFYRAATLSAADIAGLVAIHGFENVDRALARGKGVIFVTAHFGNLDIASQMFAVRGYSVVTVAEHVKPEVLFQHICRVRGGKGIKIIPVDGPLLGLMRALKRNDIVGLAADLDVTKSGLVIDFFGSPTRLPDGHVQLALRTGATIVPAFTLRRPDNTFEAHVEPPIEFESTGDAAASLRAGLSTSFECEVRTGVTKIAALMEHYIGQHPEQWVMFNPIWDAVRDQDR